MDGVQFFYRDLLEAQSVGFGDACRKDSILPLLELPENPADLLPIDRRLAFIDDFPGRSSGQERDGGGRGEVAQSNEDDDA